MGLRSEIALAPDHSIADSKCSSSGLEDSLIEEKEARRSRDHLTRKT